MKQHMLVGNYMLHRQCRGHEFESYWIPNFFRSSFKQLHKLLYFTITISTHSLLSTLVQFILYNTYMLVNYRCQWANTGFKVVINDAFGVIMKERIREKIPYALGRIWTHVLGRKILLWDAHGCPTLHNSATFLQFSQRGCPCGVVVNTSN